MADIALRPGSLEELERLLEPAQDRAASWRITQLLDHVGLYRFDDGVREALGRALVQRGISSQPPIERARRHQTVRLRLAGPSGEVAQVTSPDALQLHHCTSAGIQALGLDDPLPGSGVLWLDVDSMHVSRDDLQAAFDRLLDPAEREAIERTNLRTPVDDFRMPDFRPNVKLYGLGAAVRTLAAFGARDEESGGEDPTDPTVSKAGALVFDLVEMAVGGRWLVTCRFPGERYDGGSFRSQAHDERLQGRVCEGRTRTALLTGLGRRWERALARHDDLGPGDLGMLVLHELVDTYRPVQLSLGAWLEQWELQFNRDPASAERGTLVAIRSLVEEARDRLVFYTRPRQGDPVAAWFPAVTDADEARHVLDLHRYAVAELDTLDGRVRSAFDLLRAHEGDHLRDQVERATFLFLVPTVVAGIFGANTLVPGQQEWWGFALMLAIMVVLSSALYVYVRRRR